MTGSVFWRRARDVFQEAVEVPSAARAGFLSAACGGEAELRRAVERLLAADAEGDVRDFGESAVAATLEDALDDRRLGQRVGDYRLLRKLGGGGMGTVYLAENVAAPGRRVAVKLLRAGPAEGEVERRFRLEMQVLASLEHPNVTRLLDAGVTRGGQPYFAMEWIDGQPITRWCDARRSSVRERLELVVTVAEALQHAHRHLVVHRDIKPSNVLVTQGGRPKLLDFGIAKVLEGSPFEGDPSTATLLRPLTPGYASPEQIAGERVGTASDVYSLAVLTYELLAGRVPYDWTGLSLLRIEQLYDGQPPPLTAALDAAEEEAMRRLAEHRSTTPEQLRRALAGDLDLVLGRALHREPAQRYASAEHFAEDLRRVVEGRPVAARPASLRYRLRKLVARHRVPAAILAAAAAAILALVALLVVQSRRVVHERDLARAEQVRTEAERRRATEAMDFLVDLFQRADPGSAGKPLTPREMLRLGTARALRESGSDPASRATLLTAIADAYQNLGDFDAAAPLFEEALALRRALAGTTPDVGPAEVAASLDAVGEVLRLQGAFDAAEARSREALELRLELFGEDHEAVAESLDNLAEALHELGRYDEAEPLYQRALAIRRRRFGEADLRVAESLDHYALLVRNRGRYEEARELYAQALRSREPQLPPGHPEIAGSHYQLGSVEQDLGRLDAAERHFREALSLYRQAYDGERPAIAACLHDLGTLAHDRGDLESARSLLSEALEMRRRIYTDNHSELVQSLGMIGAVSLELGRADDAAAYLAEGLERSRDLFGDEHAYTAITRLHLGRLQALRGELDAAAATVEQAIRVLERTAGESHPVLWRAHVQLGSYLRLLGRTEEAAPHLRRGHERLRELLGEEHPITREAAALQSPPAS